MEKEKREEAKRREVFPVRVLRVGPITHLCSAPSPFPSPSRRRVDAGDKRFPVISGAACLHHVHIAHAVRLSPSPVSHLHLPLISALSSHSGLLPSPLRPANAAASSAQPTRARAPPSPASQMFLTDKYHALLPIHSPPSAKDHRKAAAAPAPASRFDAALAARLGSLLPLPASPLAALARLADLLAATLGDAVPALASAGNGDAAVAAHLDAGVALLDACNAIAARVDRLRRQRLLTRLAVHLLSSSSTPSSVQRARAALADRDGPGAGASSPPLPLTSLPFVDPPRVAGRQLTAAARVLLAVNAVSSLAATAAASILGGSKFDSASFPLVVSGDLPWAEAFNSVSNQLAVLATATTSEVDAVDEAVGKLASVLDVEGADNEAAVRAAAQEVEKRTEELAARLDRLSDAVNGVFRAALRLRNAEVGSFAVSKTRSSKK